MFLRILFTAITIWCAGNMFAQSEAGQLRHKMGKITSPLLGEISGMVPSAKYNGCFWVHNDSGDKANLYLIDSTATLLHTLRLEGVKAIDFEDIAWFYDNRDRYSLIVGDIGDNRAVRSEIVFYAMEEPNIDRSVPMSVLSGDNIQIYRAVYPDGARDAEAFFVDPKTRELVLITKRDFHVHVYTSDLLTVSGSGLNRLVKKTQLPVHFVTAADISHNGQHILVKDLLQVYLWTRLGNESVVQALGQPYRILPYQPEPQGEAIAFEKDGDTFYTISEKPLFLDSYLYRYKL